MVKNSFTCNDCNKSYLKEEEAIACEKKHKEEKQKNEELIKKNKKMVFGKTVKITKNSFDTHGGGVNFKVPKDCDLIILMGNKGGGYIPYKCLLPHQVYVSDLREAFEKEHFEVICVVGVKSSDVFPIAYKNGYGLQRWKDLEKKGDANQENSEEVKNGN